MPSDSEPEHVTSSLKARCSSTAMIWTIEHRPFYCFRICVYNSGANSMKEGIQILHDSGFQFLSLHQDNIVGLEYKQGIHLQKG
ncbi:hypothetical protein OUZ56_015666 [Daphnia magna]|uniref:Uncharacterized protein n=1 Tax=Daphnia magna TaxID=35525 RepID=A0ABR0AND9_9CRUS|nr:hypothetical protein OUZ56_015666 [Daphnia magna]